MKADGVVSAKTKLWEATKNWKPTAADLPLVKSNRLGLSENDLKIMSNAVYGEARGEPYEGQVSVAASEDDR